MNTIGIRMIVSMSRLMLSKSNNAYYMCSTVRLKSSDSKVAMAIKLRNNENTKIYGPKVTAKSTKKKEKVDKTENESKSSGKDKSGEESSSHKRSRDKDDKDGVNSGESKVHTSDVNRTKVNEGGFNSDKSVVDNNNTKINTATNTVGNKIHTRLHDKKTTEFDYILTYPMLRCEEDIDNSILKQSTERFSPSVTHIINETMSDLSKFYLERWKKKMISELGEEGFKQYQQATFRNGSNLHANIQHYLTGTAESDLDIFEDNKGHWDSIRKVLQSVEFPVAVEEPVKHQHLCYQGKFDCVAVYRDMLCVIDWKTSKKTKPTIQDTFDNPIQVAAYVGAINNSDFLIDKGLEQIKSGAIVIAYPDGQPAHVHVMDQKLCEENWKKWLERLHMYWKQVKNLK